MINREMNKRHQQYLAEKSMSERHGQVSSITYEEWLEIKGFTKRNHITMKNNELKFVNDRCKINFEKAFAKIAECCGLSEKIRNAGAAEEFQDFMMSLERFYLRKMNYKQKCINKLVHKLKEKEGGDDEQFKQGLNNAFKSADHVQYTNGYNKAVQDFLEYLKHCSTFTDMNGNTCIDNDLLNTLIDDFKNYIEEITKKEFYELMEGGEE